VGVSSTLVDNFPLFSTGFPADGKRLEGSFSLTSDIAIEALG